ncbi:coat protein [Lake Sarah-associated circular virus-34]|nr:coat protein [Lake Sarah-associated circular virus-34]
MARTHQTRKRSRPFVKSRRRVRRRTFKRRRRNAIVTTSRLLTASNPFGYRGRRLSKKRYRSALWRDTLFKTHYRSIRSQSIALPIPNSNSGETVTFLQCFDTTDVTTFWKTLGGLEQANFSTGVPWDAGTTNPESITIRGGRLWISANNRSGQSESPRIRFQLVFLKGALRNSPDTGQSNSAWDYLTSVVAGIKPIGWDVTNAPDYSMYCHPPVLSKSFDFRADDTCDIFWKIKPVKIDTAAFTRGGGWFPVWFVTMSTHFDASTGSDDFKIQLGHNLSFAASDLSS